MTQTSQELAAIIAAAQRGDSNAEAQIYNRFLRFVEQRLRDARRRRNWFWLDDIDEAAQEVFVQFFSALRGGRFRFSSEDKLKGFLLRTSFFISMNLKDRRPRERLFSQLGQDKDDDGSDISHLLGFADTAFSEGERHDCIRLLYEAVEGLNGNRRDIIQRTLEGQTVRDICAETGRSPASVSGLKFNAIKDLRELLEERGFLEHCGEALEIVGGTA